MKAHIIENGIITNTIVIDALSDNMIDASMHIGNIGDTWDGEQIIPQVIAPNIPKIVTMRQARLALLAAGLLSSVDTAMAAADDAAKIEWEYAQEVNRNHSLVQSLKVALSLTEEQLDNLFTTAAAL